MSGTASTKIVKDNIGTLAIHILNSKRDLAKMSYSEILRELSNIICDLQAEIDDLHF
ncbi:hypothetical protein [Pectinatus haikarae]|uniref:hypothetical protein n=1 Tax=Pectinatus haikarae TaxID=349096 RepID=UPI0018C6F09A|nr:hypothetical protein [Pectinatus haikarae]